MRFEISTRVFLGFSLGLTIAVIFCGKYIFVLEPHLTLDILQTSSILIAVFTFLYTTKKDEDVEITNQITIFRETIIPLEGKFLLDLQKYKEPWEYLSFDSYDFDSLCRVEEQFKIIAGQYKRSKLFSVDSDIRELSSDEIDVLNMLEEFSIRVFRYKTEGHLSLSSLHSIFVKAVEIHASRIFYVREIEYGEPLFSCTLRLYFLWKDKVSHESLSDRLARNNNWKKIISAA